MTKNYAVLIVEDNPDIASQLGDYLSCKGFTTDFAANGRAAMKLLDNERYDVVILDLMLPDTDGLTLCRHIKQEIQTNIPVLMLTARDSLDDKVEGFGVGADDYLTKPFALEEVYVRCLALTRRSQLHQSSVIAIGALQIDVGKHSASRAGRELKLSSTDFEILGALAEAYPNAVSKRHLNERIWGDDIPETDALRSHIYTLRNTVDKPFDYPMIKTLHGVGFKLEVPND